MFVATGDGKESEPSTSIKRSQPCRRFEFSEILLGTNNFDESLVIGRGGFGKVYKGTIFDRSTPIVAAIKRLDSTSNQGEPEFWAEVEMLSKLRHCHLVSLFGYCNYEKEMILVYEYVPKGTLEDHLHKLGTPLSWLQRLKICVGTARGLDYLHTGMGIDFGVIHRDVKSSNILLHESWAAKISDFGLSKIGPTNQASTYVNTRVKGTFGYLDPDYTFTGRLTRKSDVYAFGVVLLEMLCRKRAVDRTLDKEQWNLARWAQESIKEGNLKNIIDSDIRGKISPKCLKEFLRIAERCLHMNPKQRPTMAEVVVTLDSLTILQDKFNNSMQTSGATIFGKMADMFAFPSKGENSDTREDTGDCRIESLKEFKFSDLKKATSNFSEDLLLGRGNYGRVFLGWVNQNTFTPTRQGDRIPIAVSRTDQECAQGHRDSKVVVSMLGRMTHPYIITLLGYCIDKKHDYLLVYEYMQNRNLFDCLHTESPEIAELLSWQTRLTILIGVARGLAYMHSLKDQVIHRDVKSRSILLDQDFNAKLGNFGFARYGSKIGEEHVSTRVMGSLGYIDPEYLQTGRCSVKSDIYSFGVVLLETLTGQRTYDWNRVNEYVYLPTWASQFNRIDLKKILDPRLELNYPEEGAFECITLALRCVAYHSKDRPSSEEVLQSLEKIYFDLNPEHPEI